MKTIPRSNPDPTIGIVPQTVAKDEASLTKTQQTAVRLIEDLHRILEELTVHEQRNELIRELDAAILRSTFSAKEVLNLIVEKCLSLTDSRHGQIVLYNQNRLVVAASSEPSRINDELPLDRSLCGKAIVERSDQLCSDVSTIPPDSYVRYHDETLSEFVFLIQPRHVGRILGVLALERDTLDPLPPTSMDFARLLTTQAAIAIEQARTWLGVKTLYDVSSGLVAGTLTLEQSCQTILDALLRDFDFEHGQILSREGNELIIIASSQRKDIGLRPGRDSSVCGRYLLAEKGREIKVIPDILNSDYRDVSLDLLGTEAQPMQSEIIIPLIDDSGRLTGALNIESPQTDIFSEFDINIFGVVGRLLAGAISAALARRKHEEKEQIAKTNLAMTHLGHVAQSFVHRFGNNLADARLRMLGLERHLKGLELPRLPNGNVEVSDFIADIRQNLGEAQEVVRDFSNQFNPNLSGFQFRPISLSNVGKELLEKYCQKYADRGIEFRFEDQLPSIKKNGRPSVGSRAECRLTEKIYDVVENLLENAVRAVVEQHSSSGTGVVVVTASLSDALYARLQIEDNGVGISNEDKCRIFDFGYSTKKERRGSLGIGLWFCQYYALQLGGKVSFESEEGMGTSFVIEFPTIGVED